ncbi:MAG: toxin [Spirochaetes bacterium]|nr:MAG: toxin [Spirochaetota bacterium]
MKDFGWNEEKNEWLKVYRYTSFEEITFFIENGGLIDSYKHPNHKKYPNQSIFFVQSDSFIYLVPYVEEESYYFLKAIIPSRAAKKKYSKKNND